MKGVWEVKQKRNLMFALVVVITVVASICMNHLDMLDDFVIIEQSEAHTPKPTMKTMDEVPKININIASIDELQQLDGVGEKLAKRILDYREENGPFEVIQDIMRVSGIGDEKFKDMQEYITVE